MPPERRIRVRPATPEDIGFIASVVLEASRERLSRKDGWDPARWHAGALKVTADEVAGGKPHSVTHVIEAAGVPVGRLRVVRPGDHIYLGGIQLLPAYQSQGIGTSIVRRLMAEADAGRLPLRLEVEKDNPDARRLYVRLGFRVIEDRPDREVMEAGPPA